MTIIDAGQAAVAAVVPTARISDLACNPNTHRIYVSDHAGSRLLVVDGDAQAVVATIEVGNCPLGLAIDSDTNRVLVSHAGLLSIFRDPPQTRIGAVPMSTRCSLDLGVHGGVCLDPGTGTVYVSCQERSVVFALSEALPASAGSGATAMGSDSALGGLGAPSLN